MIERRHGSIRILAFLVACGPLATAHADWPEWRAGVGRHSAHWRASATAGQKTAAPTARLSLALLERGDAVDVAQLDAIDVRGIDARLAEEAPYFGSKDEPLVIDVTLSKSADVGTLPTARFGAAPEPQHRAEHDSRPREIDAHPLMDDARIALGTGKDGLAKARANALIALAPQLSAADAADAVHRARIVLGELALRDGLLDEAAAQLELAANVEGSPRLESVGPDFALAQKLLENGRTAGVLRYFDRVALFWDEPSCLGSWKATIAAGEIPDLMRAWDCTAKKAR